MCDLCDVTFISKTMPSFHPWWVICLGDVLVQEPSFSVKRVDDGTGFVQKRAKKKSVQGDKRKRGKTPKKTKMFLWGGD